VEKGKKGERKKDVKPRELNQLRHDQRIMLAYTNIKKDVYEHITYMCISTMQYSLVKLYNVYITR